MNKNKKSLKDTEDFINLYKSLLQIFSNIQEASSLNKSHIMDLVKLHKQNAFFFDKAFEQAFLKIFKSFHQKANKKIPTKFESMADLFFKQLLKSQTDEAINSYNQFCCLLSQAIFSTVMNVKVMSSRILFLVLKNLPNLHQIGNIVRPKTMDQISKAVIFLIKQKVSTYRQLGIKLSSLVLYGKSEYNQNMQNELFNILSTEENDFVRKMVITNIPINQGNIDRLLIRLRDKNSEIRATLLRRLLTQNFRLQRLRINNLYKILYDGFGTKDIICQQQALRYFASFFKQGAMDQQNKYQRFVELFQPNLLLVNPHLYILFNRLILQLLQTLPTQQMCQYIMRLCNKVKSTLKDKSVNIQNELIWLKNASNTKPQIRQINNTFEQYSPSGTQFAQLLKYCLQRKNIFGINQFLQMFINIKMPDEVGRNRMYHTLVEILKKLNFFQFKLNLKYISKNDDICNIQSWKQIHLKKFMLSYYDIPIISNSMDLIFPIITTMKYLRPDNFSNQIKQIISDFQNPDQFPVLQQKSTCQMTLNSLINNHNNGDPKIKQKIDYLKQKLQKIEDEILFLKYKTVKAVTAVGKIQWDWNLQPYMPLIQQQIKKTDQSHGLYLLGLYCLADIQRLNTFIPIFWHKVMQQPQNRNPESQEYEEYKLSLMISLKMMTDFIVKFNILNSQNIMNNTSTDESTDINSDSFMQKLTKLILDKDPDIRIFSIECLCRMIFHNRIDQNSISTYFMYLLLLWWETSTQQVNARSVHTISLFFRSYIQKGNQQVKKLAEMLCIFHKILKIFQERNKSINKKLIVYNLKLNQFIKKTAAISTTVLKYHKQKKTIWTYQQPQLGPQQMFLLYLLYQPGFQNILQKPVNMSDFYVKCPLQTLIFVKKKLQRWVQLVEGEQFYPKAYRYDKNITKKSIQQIGRFEKQIQNHISVKQDDTFNEQIIKTIERIFAQSCKYINEEAKRIAKNIQDEEIFIDIDSDAQISAEEMSEEQSQVDNDSDDDGDDNDPMDDLRSIASQSFSQSQSSIPKKNQESNKKMNNMKQPNSRMNKSRARKPIMQQSQSEGQDPIQPIKIQQEQIKPATIQKSRKRAPKQVNLLPGQQIHIRPEQRTQIKQKTQKTPVTSGKRVTRASKTFQ